MGCLCSSRLVQLYPGGADGAKFEPGGSALEETSCGTDLTPAGVATSTAGWGSGEGLADEAHGSHAGKNESKAPRALVDAEGDGDAATRGAGRVGSPPATAALGTESSESLPVGGHAHAAMRCSAVCDRCETPSTSAAE